MIEINGDDIRIAGASERTVQKHLSSREWANAQVNDCSIEKLKDIKALWFTVFSDKDMTLTNITCEWSLSPTGRGITLVRCSGARVNLGMCRTITLKDCRFNDFLMGDYTGYLRMFMFKSQFGKMSAPEGLIGITSPTIAKNLEDRRAATAAFNRSTGLFRLKLALMSINKTWARLT